MSPFGPGSPAEPLSPFGPVGPAGPGLPARPAGPGEPVAAEEMDIKLIPAQEEPPACRVRTLAFFQVSVGCRHSPSRCLIQWLRRKCVFTSPFYRRRNSLAELEADPNLDPPDFAYNAPAPAPRPRYLWQVSLSAYTLDHGLPPLPLPGTKGFCQK